MKWEETLKSNPTIPKGKLYEEIYQLCMAAYMEGRIIEKKLAMEAYRLQCYRLFGNQCMDFRLFGKLGNQVCKGNCQYMKKIEAILYRLDN